MEHRCGAVPPQLILLTVPFDEEADGFDAVLTDKQLKHAKKGGALVPDDLLQALHVVEQQRFARHCGRAFAAHCARVHVVSTRAWRAFRNEVLRSSPSDSIAEICTRGSHHNRQVESLVRAAQMAPAMFDLVCFPVCARVYAESLLHMRCSEALAFRISRATDFR